MNAIRDGNHIRIYDAFLAKESIKEIDGRFYDALSQRPFSQKLLEMGFEKKRSASTGAVEWIGLSIRGVASRL